MLRRIFFYLNKIVGDKVLILEPDFWIFDKFYDCLIVDLCVDITLSIGYNNFLKD